MTDSTVTRRIAYIMSEKKKGHTNMPALLAEGSRRGLEFVELDVDRPIAEQLPFLGILHKEFARAHPKVPFIDPLDSLTTLMDREATFYMLDKCRQQITHCMSLLWSPKDVGLPGSGKGAAAGSMVIQEPMLLQEFVNHGGIIFKVQRIPKAFVDPVQKATDAPDASVYPGFDPYVPAQVWQARERSLDQDRDVRLFGFDIIIDTATGDYYVIDVNYFPSYSGESTFQAVLCDIVERAL
ncbi:hypothetical protein THASP1DRAFT_23806 [Thamnocephalis sphaerospora]|uniref:Uncharacterized protein n=1 Tax=Thamnocephalis sphaerospora TaxID=78915 RepID=A0A4P9XS44_9FUNG|nr:hypothetical protein THASP1DRAFT_23806 [Thamnocephalis sphaerospora]|eukprot:RKP08160.1 hypothetical protein THASP1DRAFT_23806 [Thamnocephalis sphaerospora]